MRDLMELRDLARSSGAGRFLRFAPNPVLVGVEILGGELRRRTPRPSRQTRRLEPSTRGMRHRAHSVYSSTLSHVSEEEFDGEVVDPGMFQRRPLRRPVVLDLARKDSSDARWIHLGRRHDNDAVLNDYTVSSRHARFRRDDPGGPMLVEDVGSTNGTTVQGLGLEPGRPHLLASGDVVTFGRLRCYFFEAADFYRWLGGDRAA
ncbi:MAG: FHA domain-containing protein [Myxococcota bacterium]